MAFDVSSVLNPPVASMCVYQQATDEQIKLLRTQMKLETAAEAESLPAKYVVFSW